jgi:hypothetical protein
MRPTPPEWTPALFAGDMWAAVRVATRAYLAWDALPPAETWAEQGDALWLEDTGPALGLSPIGGAIRKDWSGPAARTSAAVDVPLEAAAGVTRGQWAAIVGYLTTPAQAPPSGDPAGVPSAVIADLYVSGIETARGPQESTATLLLEDLVTLLGARVLDTGTGPTGYLPAARTAHGVIRELVALFAPADVLVIDDAAPDAPWAPTLTDGTPDRLTGNVWSAIETVATLAGLALDADGAILYLRPGQTNPTHSGITITAAPTLSGVQAVTARRTHAPAVTRVIASGVDAAGSPIAGRAADDAAAAAQGFHWDDEVNIGTADPTQAALAALARLTQLRGEQDAGELTVPWLPILEPGDVLTVAWADEPPAPHYVGAVDIPIDPTAPVRVTLRGYVWPTWAQEPPDQTWADLPTELTWGEDTQ